jgi:pilus assembly protein CpaB
MKLKTSVSLLIAVALGLLTAKVGRDMLIQNRAKQGDSKMTKVIAASHDLEPGQLLEAKDLVMLDMPVSSTPDKSFVLAKDVVGRAVNGPVVKGQVLFEGLMAAEGTAGGLQALVPDGMRAVTVEVSESSGLAGLLVPGCHVDIVSTLKKGHESLSRTIVENVQVRAVGRKLVKDPKDDSKSTSVRTVTVVCTPKQVEAIELASTAGRPRLSLRSKTDTMATESEGITMSELTGEDKSAEYEAMVASDKQGPTTNPVAALDNVALQQILAELQAMKGAAPAGAPTAAGAVPATQPAPARMVQVIRSGRVSTSAFDGEVSPAGTTTPAGGGAPVDPFRNTGGEHR